MHKTVFGEVKVIVLLWLIMKNAAMVVHWFVCFKGGMGTGVYPSSPLCLMDVSIIAEIPKVMSSLCTIENSVLGTRTMVAHSFILL